MQVVMIRKAINKDDWFNCVEQIKAFYGRDPEKVEVKVAKEIVLSDSEFRKFESELLCDNDIIKENKELMKVKEQKMEKKTIACYARVATEEQTGAAEEKAKLEKKLFRTLKNYSHGYYSNCTPEEKKAYDEKVKALKERILADVEHAPEIIAEEFAHHQALMYRAQMTGKYATLKCNAEWKAIDNVCLSLVDSKPFKAKK